MMDALFSGLQIGQNLADEGYTAVGLGNLGERGLLTAFILTAVFFRDQLEELPEHMSPVKEIREIEGSHRPRFPSMRRIRWTLRRAGAPDITAMVGFILSATRKLPSSLTTPSPALPSSLPAPYARRLTISSALRRRYLGRSIRCR